MTRKNNLESILHGWGFKKIQPTEDLLKELGMSAHRFFQILENRGKSDITVTEAENLQAWLTKITNRPDISLFETSKRKETV